jgi:hypothetical protein
LQITKKEKALTSGFPVNGADSVAGIPKCKYPFLNELTM